MRLRSYRDLVVWQKAMEVAVQVYALADTFPRQEFYGLALQVKRSAASIPSNIAEGYRRNSPRDFRRFLSIAFGSGAELETQIELIKRVSWGRVVDFAKIDNDLSEVMKMLNSFIRKLGTN